MPRLPRRWQWTDAACYHLMDRGHNRETVLHARSGAYAYRAACMRPDATSCDRGRGLAAHQARIDFTGVP